MWTLHEKFSGILETIWARPLTGTFQYILAIKLKALKNPLKELNRVEFGHISAKASRANSEFQLAYQNLDVVHATEADRRLVSDLRERALFLAEAERQFFCQKLKTKHLVSADKGSKYFHDLIRNKQRSAAITSVCALDGTPSNSLDHVGSIFVDHFTDLFGTARSRQQCDFEYLANGPMVSPAHSNILLAGISNIEIKEALFAMGDEKAPGPDGFSAAFFKKNWDRVGHLVCSAVKEFFQSGNLLKQWNHTTIAVIPKSNHARNVADYRPIACCNVSYKIITKILASRLSMVLPDIIDSAQGAFIPGRAMADNIFLVQELIRGYGRKRTSLRCMIKVDLHKAYDTVDWDFLAEILRGLGFPPRFVGWIMECVTTTSFSVSTNGCLYGHFEGKRGLRQGDPISPLLFTICLEYFSRVLKTKASNPAFSFHPKCQELGITHIAFADDLMLFSRGDVPSVSILMDALKELEYASGLSISIHKSNIFTAGVHDGRLDFFNLPTGNLPVRYLGIPLDNQRLKVACFSTLIDSITHRISVWKGYTLSYAGRLELLSSIVQGIIGFWIQTFPLPVTVIDHIISLCRKFLWGGKHASISWETICLPKKEGGLGIHDFKIWNKAFLAKVLWDIHRRKDSLWVKWVHCHYLNGTEIWNWTPSKGDSTLLKGLASTRDCICAKAGSIANGINKMRSWCFDDIITVHKAYDFLRIKGQTQACWRNIWKNFIPPKFSFIAWLAAHERLTTRDRLHFLDLDFNCSLCVGNMESATHLFFRCPFSSQIWFDVSQWFGFPFQTRTIRGSLRWIKKSHVGSRMQSKGINLALLCTIYHIWKIRNAVLHDEDRLDTRAASRVIVREVYRILLSVYPSQSDHSRSLRSQFCAH